MNVLKRFPVLGEAIEVLVSKEMSGGSMTVIRQTSPPGGGPPPHQHSNEDEVFTVLEGEFEIFDGNAWHPLNRGETAFGPRGRVHTFRNCGKTPGILLVIASPAGLDVYLEKISPLVIPRDMEQLLEISQQYGITFVR